MIVIICNMKKKIVENVTKLKNLNIKIKAQLKQIIKK